jgi:hypothetical protein
MPWLAWFWSRSSPACLVLLTGLAGCSVLVDQNRVQCLTDEDCTARGGDFSDSVCEDTVCRPSPTWSCLGSAGGSTPTESRKANVVLHIRDLITDQPTPGVSAQVCQKLDVTCSQPIMPVINGDQDGNLTLPLDLGFDGYAELRTPNTMPGLFFFAPPIDGDRDIPLVPLFIPVELAKLAQLNGKTVVPERGHLMLGAYDCLRGPAQGVSLSTPDGDGVTSSFYVLQRIPTSTAASTDLSGRGGFINLRAGQVSVDATLAADGRHIGTVNLFVRPGAVTYTTLAPSASKQP